MAEQSYEEDLLRQWFPIDAGDALKPFTESDIRGIADVLERSSRDAWSRIPRIYSILRKIRQLGAIDAFIDSGVTDVSFPFSKSTLPEALRDHSARLRFLELQHLVYNTEALDLERQARHGHFSDPHDVPLKKVGELGKGGFGYVDRVVSTISHKEYARKLILRGRTFRKDKQVLNAFTKELSNLKRLSHRHLVNLVGSYTDKKFVAIIMLPVADTNMQTFLEKTDLDDRARSLIRPFFGCLTSALCYLHDNRIRHKDIKPSNVLIKHDQVYLTDFGTSLDWSGNDNSTTATALPTTPRYCAPEVMSYVARNTSSDIWSLGCVFLEMWTVLRHHTLEDLRNHMCARGTQVKEYHSNPDGFTGWIQALERIPGPLCDHAPSTWISNMLQREAALRWNCHILENRIREASTDPTAEHAFSGLCCLEPDDDTTDDTASFDESETGTEIQSTPASGPRNAPEPLVKAKARETLQDGKSSNVQVPPATAREDVVPIPRVVISDYSMPLQPWVEDESESLAREIGEPAASSLWMEVPEPANSVEDEVQSSSRGEDTASSSDDESLKGPKPDESTHWMSSASISTQPWGTINPSGKQRLNTTCCRFCTKLIENIADLFQLPCHHWIHKACFSRGYPYHGSCRTCSMANRKAPKQANRGFAGPHSGSLQRRIDSRANEVWAERQKLSPGHSDSYEGPSRSDLERRPVPSNPVATSFKSKSTGSGRSLRDLFGGTRTTKPLQTKAPTKSKRATASERQLRSDRKFAHIESGSSSDEKERYEAGYRTRSELEQARNYQRIATGMEDSTLARTTRGESSRPRSGHSEVPIGDRGRTFGYQSDQPRSASVEAQTGYRTPPSNQSRGLSEHESEPGFARDQIGPVPTEPEINPQSQSRSETTYNYPNSRLTERFYERGSSQDPPQSIRTESDDKVNSSLPRNSTTHYHPVLGGRVAVGTSTSGYPPRTVLREPRYMRRDEKERGRAHQQSSTPIPDIDKSRRRGVSPNGFGPNDVQYARKYGPEDVRWAPRSRENDGARPSHSRTATYVY